MSVRRVCKRASGVRGIRGSERRDVIVVSVTLAHSMNWALPTRVRAQGSCRKGRREGRQAAMHCARGRQVLAVGMSWEHPGNSQRGMRMQARSLRTD
jgi:hypothetical protein